MGISRRVKESAKYSNRRYILPAFLPIDEVRKLKLAALCSGGKDGSYALWRVLEEGHEVAYIVSLIPEREDSWMFHKPDSDIIEMFAEASETPLKTRQTSGIKEEELEDLKHILKQLSIDGIVSGALASTYQKERINKICEGLGLESLTPIWHAHPFELLENMVENGFDILITSVSAKGLDEGWLGRKIDPDCIGELRVLNDKWGLHPTGEGGEYETLTLDAPFFRKRINIVDTEKFWEGDRGHLKIKQAELSEK